MNGYLKYLSDLATSDVDQLHKKEETYKGSWKRRGGVGAFMMLARKWDRLEQMAQQRHYDIFQNAGNGEDGTPLAEIRDLRRYLLLVEAELIERGQAKIDLLPAPLFDRHEETLGSPADGAHHHKQMEEDFAADLAFDAAREDRVFGKR